MLRLHCQPQSHASTFCTATAEQLLLRQGLDCLCSAVLLDHAIVHGLQGRPSDLLDTERILPHVLHKIMQQMCSYLAAASPVVPQLQLSAEDLEVMIDSWGLAGCQQVRAEVTLDQCCIGLPPLGVAGGTY